MKKKKQFTQEQKLAVLESSKEVGIQESALNSDASLI